MLAEPGLADEIVYGSFNGIVNLSNVYNNDLGFASGNGLLVGQSVSGLFTYDATQVNALGGSSNVSSSAGSEVSANFSPPGEFSADGAPLSMTVTIDGISITMTGNGNLIGFQNFMAPNVPYPFGAGLIVNVKSDITGPSVFNGAQIGINYETIGVPQTLFTNIADVGTANFLSIAGSVYSGSGLGAVDLGDNTAIGFTLTDVSAGPGHPTPAPEPGPHPDPNGSVPEPVSTCLFGLGLLALLSVRGKDKLNRTV
jgi:hypothetical protein